MAQVVLTRDEATNGELPAICIRCGGSPTRMITTGSLIRARRFRLPLCDAHRALRRRRLPWMTLAVFSSAVALAWALAAFLLVQFHIAEDLDNWFTGGTLVCVGVPAMLGLPLALVSAVMFALSEHGGVWP